MKLSFLLIPILALSASADTIRMRNGIEYQGVLVSETDDKYTFLIQYSKTIHEQRIIAKTEVLEIVGDKNDSADFEVIKAYLPTPDLLDLNTYNSQLKNTRDFQKKYPKSEFAKTAQEILSTLEAEQIIVVEGGIKLNGEMIAAEDRASRAYPLDASIAAAEVTRLGQARKLTPALRAWSELELEFPSSQAYIATIPYALKLMRTQLRMINQSLATFDQRMQKRAEELQGASAKDRQRAQRAHAENAAAYTRRIKTQQAANIQWLSLNPNDRDIMNIVKNNLEQAIHHLSNLDSATLPDSEQAWTQTWTILSGEPSAEEATLAISEAKAAGLPAPYLKILEEMVPATEQ